MKNKRTWIATGMLLMVGLLAVSYVAFWKGKYVSSAISFYPINGDFQNYNVFRRLLNGQTPYVDFSNYLGVGVLYVNTGIMRLIGGTFADSYFITRAVALVVFALTVGAFAYCICCDIRASVVISGAFTAFISNMPYWCSYLPSFASNLIMNSTFDVVFTSLAEIGNSFRGLRGFVFVIEMIIYCVFLGNKEIRDWLSGLAIYWQGLLVGFVPGYFVPWSNDWGIACYVSTAFVFFMYMCRKYKVRYIAEGTFAYIVSSIAALFLSLTIITGGKPKAWLDFTLGVSSWQKTYYGTHSFDKIMTFGQVPPFGDQKPFYRVVTILMILFFVVTVLSFIFSKELSKRKFLLAYLSTSITVYTYLYWLGSSYDREILFVFMSLLYIGPIAVAYSICSTYVKKHSTKRGETIVRIAEAATVFLVALACVDSGNTYRRGYLVQEPASSNLYISSLGGNIGSYHDDIEYADEQLKGKTLFSTYASAVECIREEFQPTGSDYIIHALGDKAREHYLETFLKCDPDVVSFINRSFTKWEGWATFENWDFYRKVLPDYSYYFNTEYASYFLKDAPGRNSADVDIDYYLEKMSDDEVIIHVQTNPEVEHGLADVCLSYSSSFSSFSLKQIPFGRIVFATGSGTYLFSDQFEGYFLPSEAERKYVPVEIINGEGWLSLRLLPEGSCAFRDIGINVEQVIYYSQIGQYYENLKEG